MATFLINLGVKTKTEVSLIKKSQNKGTVFILDGTDKLKIEDGESISLKTIKEIAAGETSSDIRLIFDQKTKVTDEELKFLTETLLKGNQTNVCNEENNGRHTKLPLQK